MLTKGLTPWNTKIFFQNLPYRHKQNKTLLVKSINGKSKSKSINGDIGCNSQRLQVDTYYYKKVPSYILQGY